MSKVVVISAHPDDEVLGCGGTLLKHKANGDTIAWLITTSMRKDQGFSEERIATREQEIQAIKERLSIQKVYKLGFPTMRLSDCLLYTSPSPRDLSTSRMPSSA